MPNQLLDDNSLCIEKSPVSEESLLKKELMQLRFWCIVLFVSFITSFLFLRIYYNLEFIAWVNYFKSGNGQFPFLSPIVIMETLYLYLFSAGSFVILLIPIKSLRAAVFNFFDAYKKAEKKQILAILFPLSYALIMIGPFCLLLISIGVLLSYAITCIFEIGELFVSSSGNDLYLDSYKYEADIAFLIISVVFCYLFYIVLKSNIIDLHSTKPI